MRKIIFSTHFFCTHSSHLHKKIESNLPFLSVRGIIAQPITADITIKKRLAYRKDNPTDYALKRREQH